MAPSAGVVHGRCEPVGVNLPVKLSDARRPVERPDGTTTAGPLAYVDANTAAICAVLPNLIHSAPGPAWSGLGVGETGPTHRPAARPGRELPA
jgi:hypothetical protein